MTLFASMMARSSPSPSPLKAGPKHSGLRINNLITKLAFSSTLSPLTLKITYECTTFEIILC